MNKTVLAFLLLCLAALAVGSLAYSKAPDAKLPSPAAGQKLGEAYFAGGCFWKSQYVFGKVPGVVRTRVGFTGGTTTRPTYEQVCTNRTGHAETVLVLFDPSRTTYRKLLEVFFANFDPTTVNRQGPDVGTQYRSAIFCTTPQQIQEATAYKQELERSHRFSAPIVTSIQAAGPFYEADEHHQDYYAKHGAVCF